MQCDNTPNFDTGPCKFAPPDSNFPFIDQSCEECYFNLSFGDKEYLFPGNKISPSFGFDHSQMSNVFFAFYLDQPDSDEGLSGSIDVKTPLVKVEDITKSIASPPPLVSTAFGIYNYCKDFFEPIPYDISQSYHRLTRTELFFESDPFEIDSELYKISYYYLNGELHATFNFNGVTEMIRAEYKVKCFVYQKI